MLLTALFPVIGNSEENEKVSIQFKWFHQFQFAGYYAALEKGFYAEEGLNVELRERDASADDIDRVLNGESQFGVSDGGILRIRQQGKAVTVLAQIFQHSPLIYITLPDSGLRTPYDLIGRKVLTTPGDASAAPLDAMIVKALGSLDKVDIIPHSYRNEDLLEGRVDAMLAYSSNEPFWFKERGINVNIIDPRDYGIDFYGDNLYTTEKEILNHPNRVEKVIRATLKGWKYALEHKDEIIDLILRKYNTLNHSREHLIFEARQIDLLINPRFVEIGQFEPSRYQKIAGIYSYLGLTDKFTVDKQFYYQPSTPRVELTMGEKAWLKAHPDIRLGIDPNYPPFEFIGKRGEYVGMAVDYLALINERLGADMRIVPGLSWSEVMDRAKQGEIDAIPTLAKTEEHSDYFRFTGPYITFPVVFLTRKDKEPIHDFYDLAGSRLAMVKDYFYVEEIFRKHPEIEPYFMNSPLGALNALAAGTVDAAIANFAVANHLILKHNLGNIRQDSVADVSSRGFGYGVRKDWPELVSILDKAIASISEEKHDDIRNRWITYNPASGTSKPAKAELTEEERSWVRNHPIIKVSNMVNYAPISYEDAKGEAVGFAVDYFKLVAEKTGLNVEFTSDTFGNLLQMIKERKIDVLGMANKTEERELFLSFPEPFLLNNPMVIFGQDGEPTIDNMEKLAGKKLAINQGWVQGKYLKENHPEVVVVDVLNMAEGFQSVASGTADGYLTRLITGNHFIKQNLIIGIAPIGGIRGIPVLKGADAYFAVRKDWSILASIINKGMRAITYEERSDLLSRWDQAGITLAGEGIDLIVLTEKEHNWLKSNPKVRVHNEMNWPPFNFNKEGRPQGLSVDFMNLLASKTGLEVEYVSGPSWNEFLEMMKSGELDVMLNIVKTPERQKYLLYTPPYIENPNTILSREENTYHTIEELSGKTVSIPKGFFYEEILKRDYPGIDILAVKDTLESMKAVSFGNAAAAFGELAVFDYLLKEHMMTGLVVSGEVDLGNPEFTMLNIATRKDLPHLAAILKKGLTAVTREEKRKIKNAWISTGDKESPSPYSALGLSEAEIQWLKNNPTIRLGVDPAWPPFEYFDDAGGYSGVVSGFIDAISKRLAIEMTPAKDLTWSQVVEKTKAGEIDVQPGVMTTPEGRQYLNFTKSYINFPVVIAIHKDMPFISTVEGLKGFQVGVVKDYYIEQALSNDYQNLKLVPFENISAGLKALNNGQVDAFFGNLISITTVINQLSLDNIKISAATDYKIGLAMGVRKDLPELTGILNKALDSMSEQEKASIKNTWISGMKVQVGVDIKKILVWAVPIGGCIILIISIIVFWNRRLSAEIIERKRAERKVKESEERFREAKKIAEEATQAKSDFLANMSHEIRTPMNAILGLTDLCLRTEVTPKQKDYLSKVHSSANSLLGIINDILDFSKIEAGKLDIESVPFSLDKVLTNLATIISVKTQEKELELLFYRAPDVPGLIVGDPLRLGQILINLANNAVKFTEEGQIIVNILIEEMKAHTVTLNFAVKDSGIGMTEEQMNRLFQSFSQADTSTTRKYGGTGLGLVISKQLVELMNGKIWVESKPGEGSTFLFTATFGQVEKQARERIFQPVPELRGIRALVVDDNKHARKILKTYLEQFTFTVDCAASGEEAIKKIKKVEEPFKVILMDYLMHGMNGIETACAIKQISGNMEMPKIILITSFSHSEYADEQGIEQLDNILTKPTNPSLLFDVIMESFGHESSRSAIGPSFDVDVDQAALQAIQGARILLVEDNKINRQVAAEFLEQARFYVDIAENGQEAINILQSEKYDCVLMDIQMPVMDGLTATSHLREKEQFKDLPVLAMTANATVEDKEQTMAAGMNDHITKPINPQDLLNALIRWVPSGERHLPDPVVPMIEISPDEKESLPTSLPGIDIETGVSKLQGNRKLFVKLLKEFYQDHKDDINLIRQAIEQEDYQTAERLAHTIKGVAATIGAMDLYQKAKALEAAVKEGSASSLPVLIEQMEFVMMLVIEGLSGIGRREKAEKDQQRSANPEEIFTLLSSLEELLNELDPSAEEAAASLADAVGAMIDRKYIRKLMQHVKGFQFDEALEALAKIKEMVLKKEE